jgi:putative transposase
MLVTRTQQVALTGDHFTYWCHKAKNVYNKANYLVRQEFFVSGAYLSNYDVYHLLKHDEEYRELPSLVANEVLRCLHQAWRAFFASSRSYCADPSRFLGRPRPPRYKDKDGEMTLHFPRNHLSHRERDILLPKKVGRYRIRHALPRGADVRMVRVVPSGGRYVAEIVYRRELPDPVPNASGPVLGIDLGLENIITVADSNGTRPWAVKGGALKSANRYYNKELARLRSLCEKAGMRTTKRIKRLTAKRNRIVKNALHHISRHVASYAKRAGARAIVIGQSERWKQGVRLGKRTNQSFVQIPFHALVDQIRYKAEELGIKVVLAEESYTSRCSFLDGEEMRPHKEYAGRRVRRGLFVSGTGTAINADVNAAYNIIRKVFPNAFAEGIEDVSLHPVCRNMFSACECT